MVNSFEGKNSLKHPIVLTHIDDMRKHLPNKELTALILALSKAKQNIKRSMYTGNNIIGLNPILQTNHHGLKQVNHNLRYSFIEALCILSEVRSYEPFTG